MAMPPLSAFGLSDSAASARSGGGRSRIAASAPIATLAALGLIAAPAPAITNPQSVAASAYVRARAADALGELQASAAGYAAALAVAPGDTSIGVRAYRAAMAAGDKPLALRAARMLDAAGKLPPDGRLLLLTEAVQSRDWAAAQAAADAVQKEGIFTFLLPPARAWIAYGSKQGDPFALLGATAAPAAAPAPTDPVAPAAGVAVTALPTAQASPYVGEARALLLLAGGKTEEGVAATKALGAGGGISMRLRLLAAAALQREGQKPRALDMLAGDDPTLVAARRLFAADKPLFAASYTAADGLADLFLRVAIDVNRQRVSPLSLILARLATFLAPDNATAWLGVSDALAQDERTDAALAALAKIAPRDMFADAAVGQRIRLLVARDDKAGALAEAQAKVRQPDVAADDWMRLGDLYQAADRQGEAADAYGKALALTEAAKAPSDAIWPILLLQGGALDRSGHWPAGKAAIQRALALAPNQAVLLNYLGYSQLERRENVVEARALVERASKLRPDDPSITDSLGWSYYLTGDLPRAIDTLERAAKGSPAESEISEHLGDAYWKAGRRYEARYAWRAALVTAEEAEAPRIRAKIDAGLTSRTVAP